MQLMLSQPKIDVDSPVQPVAGFDPAVVRPGDVSIYRVTFNALETAIEWPDRIPVPQSLSTQPGGRGQMLAMSGPLITPRTTFNYRVRGREVGQFTIPEFTVIVNGKPVAIPAAHLEVTAALPPGTGSPEQILLELPTNGLYVGQSLTARIIFQAAPGSTMLNLAQPQLNGQGFIVDQSSARARIESLPSGPSRTPVVSYVYEMSLTPIAVGKLTVSAQAYAIGNRVTGSVLMSNPGAVPPTPYTLVDSDPVTLQVRPLPRESELPGFTGAVGSYSLDPPELSTNIVSVGEPLQLKIRIRGEGNLARLVPPQVPQLSDWQVFATPAESTPPQILQAQGHVTFVYTLIPLSDKARATPALPFSTFDPERGAYTDLTVPAMSVTVLPGTVSAADLQAVLQAQKLDRESEKEPALSGLALAPGLAAGLLPIQQRAWFPFLHLVPAGGLLSLWLWDRRRRFLEQHPAIMRRRRARRALRRERRLLERAAKGRDGANFAAFAVNAMKIAVAPHYPAEPRALVGADVLGLLSENERSGTQGRIVRRLFARSDAILFGAASADLRELLEAQPEIEAVLDDLEARLCG